MWLGTVRSRCLPFALKSLLLGLHWCIPRQGTRSQPAKPHGFRARHKSGAKLLTPCSGLRSIILADHTDKRHVEPEGGPEGRPAFFPRISSSLSNAEFHGTQSQHYVPRFTAQFHSTGKNGTNAPATVVRLPRVGAKGAFRGGSLPASGSRAKDRGTEHQYEVRNSQEWSRERRVVSEQDALIEHRKRLFSRLPKRGLLEGSNIQWEFWDGQQWQPYELPPPPFFFAITQIPDPDAPDFKQPPT